MIDHLSINCLKVVGNTAIMSGVVVSSTVNGQPGTFGSATPTLPAAGLLKNGSLRAIGPLDDARPTTRPATFRTNFGLVETSGNSATVRVTLRFNYPAGTKLQAEPLPFLSR